MSGEPRAVESPGTGLPTSLQQAVQAMFEPHGPLVRAAEGFRAREGQTRLALAVARVLEQGGVLVAEAATGVGKTFAYLVPALLSGERVLLSTATTALPACAGPRPWATWPWVVGGLSGPVALPARAQARTGARASEGGGAEGTVMG